MTDELKSYERHEKNIHRLMDSLFEWGEKMPREDWQYNPVLTWIYKKYPKGIGLYD